MSFRALHAAACTPAATPAARVVMSLLALHKNHATGHCYPSQALLAREAGMDERTVRQAIGQLAEAGLICVKKAGGKGAGYRATDAYHLAFEAAYWARNPNAAQGEASDAPGRHVGQAAMPGDDASPGRHVGKGGDARKPGAGAPLPGAGVHRTRKEPEEESGKDASQPRSAIDKQAQEVAALVWAEIPTQRAPYDVRKRSESQAMVAKACRAALKAGADTVALVASVRAYYADPEQQREGYRYAKGAQRLISSGAWAQYTPGPAASGSDDEDDGEAYDVASALFGAPPPAAAADIAAAHPGGYSVRQMRLWLEEYRENPGHWPGERGPRPGQVGCMVPADLVAELLGVTA